MKNAKKILAIVLVLSLVLPIFSLTAAATSNGSIDASDEPLSTFQQYKENIANEKYNILLMHWAYDKEYPSDEYADFPSFYGGAYIDESKNLVIQVTEYDKAKVEYFKKLIDLDSVVFEQVEYSYAKLVEEKDAAVANMAATNREFSDTITGIGISIPKNAVNIYIYKPNIQKYSYNIQSVVDALTEFDKINIIETTGRDAPSASVGPGVEFQFSGGNRSTGFWAYDANGNLGIITAPHDSVDDNDVGKIGNVTFGVAVEAVYGGSVDAVFIKRTNTSFTPDRFVSGIGASHYSGTYRSLAVGSATYSRGFKSLGRAGVVDDVNYTTSYGVNSCVLSTAYCQGGDSGGIVMGSGGSTQRYVVGIITGHRTDNNYQIYCKAGNILSRLTCTVY